MRPKVFVALLLACALAVAPGCGRRSPVKVLVLLDGKPLEGATVVLVQPDGKGENASGLTGTDGTATIAPLGKAGVRSGTYKVLVTKGDVEVPTTTGRLDPMSPEAMKMMKGTVERKEERPKSEVPEKYGQLGSTPFTLTVPVEISPVKIELKSAS
jgi:hypothetical protein